MTETLSPLERAVLSIEISVIEICFGFPSGPPRRLVLLHHVVVVLDLESQFVLGLLGSQ